jgi:cell division septum initiation protein DivIVA
MQWPGEPARDDGTAPPLRLGPTGYVEVAPDLASQADDRFQAVCDELGILLARRVEPVSARVLPFGTEQVAIVQLRDGADGTELLQATGHGTSRAEAVAGAAIDAVTGGRSVLAAALPGAVAEGKVRSAVVFGEGEAPVRWGRADDEARLAALYAVVPHLGSFTATTGTDTYRVLRLPGVGVALVAEGQSAATWVDGWFAALLHATQFALRTTPTTDVVATASAAGTTSAGTTSAGTTSAGTTSAGTTAASTVAEDPAAHTARVLEELEDECRRILSAAQDQARSIREDAERDAASTRDRDGRTGRDRRRRDEADSPERLAWARREGDALLEDAERARATVLADARREAEAQRLETERACADLLATTKDECARLRDEARRDVKHLRREAKRLRKSRPTLPAPRATDRWDDVVGDARRTADDLLRDARRAADDLVRDAARTRQRLVDDAVGQALVPPLVGGPNGLPVTPGLQSEQATAALLAAAAESISTMSALLARLGVATEREDTRSPTSGAPRFGD